MSTRHSRGFCLLYWGVVAFPWDDSATLSIKYTVNKAAPGTVGVCGKWSTGERICSKSSGSSQVHFKGQIKCHELPKHRIPCCANSAHAHILNNTTCGSLLNSERNNRAKNNRGKRQGVWEEWSVFCPRGGAGNLGMCLLLLRHQIKHQPGNLK